MCCFGSNRDIEWVYGGNKLTTLTHLIALVLNILELVTPLTKQQTKFSNCLNCRYENDDGFVME